MCITQFEAQYHCHPWHTSLHNKSYIKKQLPIFYQIILSFSKNDIAISLNTASHLQYKMFDKIFVQIGD